MTITLENIAPQLAKEGDLTLLTTMLTNDNYVMEQKLDGNRVMIVSPGKDAPPFVLTRNGNAYTKKIPAAIRDLRFGEDIKAGEIVIDGELMRNGSNDYTYWAFDMPCLPRKPGFDNDLPLDIRRQALEVYMENVGIPAGLRLVPQAKTKDEKIALVEKAMRSNFEGLLVKRAKSLYNPGGRTIDWVKLKFTTTADVIVTGVRTDGKDSVDLGLLEGPVDDGEQVVDLKNVGRASLIGKEKAGTIAVGDVLEVRYLYTGAGGRLYQPTILRKRDDKPLSECTTDQLKHVNKSVMEVL